MPEFPKARHAYGVDPHRPERYSLRQARYDALARDIDDWAGAAARDGRKVRILDVACGSGLLLRHLECRPHFASLLLSGADLLESKSLYNRDRYCEFFTGDLMRGYPQIPSGEYDVVVCEQLLEHLPRLEIAIATLERVLAPGGRLIVGVPIFLPPLVKARNFLVPILDRLFQRSRTHGHIRAFSLASLLAEIRHHTHLRVIEVRGFRIVSGGILRPLENFHWWWRLNRWIGSQIPAACIEVQAIMEKPSEPGCEPLRSSRASASAR